MPWCMRTAWWRVMGLQLMVIVGVLGAGGIWWYASNREGNAAAAAQRKKQSEKRARFNRGLDDAAPAPIAKTKLRSFGNR